MRKIKPIWESDSVIQEDTNIDSFIPPHPEWNYVSLSNHPECKNTSDEKNGKWLIFVSDEVFIETFREVARMAKEMKLTDSFKARGSDIEGNEHVFCIYCPDYTNISFVKKIGKVLLEHKFIDRFGYKYKDGTKALFFKTDEATRFMSKSLGKSLTLFKYTDRDEFFVKEFDKYGKAMWELANSDNPQIVENFEAYLFSLGTEDIEE